MANGKASGQKSTLKLLRISAKLDTTNVNINECVMHVVTEFDAIETGSQYRYFELTNKTVRKSDLKKASGNRRTEFFPEFEVFCLPEDQEEAQASLNEACKRYATEKLRIAQAWERLVNKGHETLTAKEFEARCF
ncbi:hypothetical protein HNP46_000401 [Pseudomonas nitritireducens]|uniref:Uncharacterized protein n=1 Tax=Pseudomonas nitroreducens TaxID=46680 RepID=A0A7W7NZR7_PSENT|nr:hypothetical protein [Pseudomonas nitritireducens]MBB4861590.1 hypothetical protein [Pseudomonas nitritireducens]